MAVRAIIAGCGGYFYLAGANPLLLEPVLNDASLGKTTFVLLHAGAVAYTPAIAYLLMKPNVYAVSGRGRPS